MIYICKTPIYLKCGLLLKKSDSLFKEVEKYKEKYKYINLETKILFENKILLLFKISYFKIKDFKSSPDYKIIIESFNFNNSVCYYCSELNESEESIIYDIFKTKNIKYGSINELAIKGIDYINNNIENAFFNLPKKSVSTVISVGQNMEKITQKNTINLKNNLYPYLVTLGQEGINVYRVDSINSIKKIGENSFGPTTLWSIFTLYSEYEEPDFAVDEAINGNNRLIDLSVGDIYGGSYENMSLSSDLIGSSFGKFKNLDDLNKIGKKDVAKSLCILYGATFSHVTALVSYKEKIEKVIISGNPFHSLELFEIIQTSVGRYSNNSLTTIFSDYSDYYELIGMCVELNKNL